MGATPAQIPEGHAVSAINEVLPLPQRTMVLMQKPKDSFPPIQGVVMDKSYPLITWACQLW